MNEANELGAGGSTDATGSEQPAAKDNQQFFGFSRDTIAKMPLSALLYHILTGSSGGASEA